MKFFGWGKSKEIPPQALLQQVKNSDPRSSSRHGLDRGTFMRPKIPCKGGVIRNKQQGLFGVEDDGYLHGASSSPTQKVDSPGCGEKLQDTIRFVLSHEQEGLLAIGTFALEQLTAVRNAIDEHHQKTAAGQDGYESCTGMMQSSDDEDGSWLTSARKNMRVYGSDTSGVDSGASDDGQTSKVLTLYKSNRTPIAGVKPIVLLTTLSPELRKVFDPVNKLYEKSQLPNFVPHWTDSVAPPVQLARAGGPWADDESYYTSRFCGLFGSKKKTASKQYLSKRGTVYIGNVEDSEKKLNVCPDAKKSTLRSFCGNGMPSIGKLAKMWKSSCKQSSARIAPERNPCSPQPSQEFKGPPTGIEREVITAPAPQPQNQSAPRRLPTGACSPKVAEFRRRVAMQQGRTNLQANANTGGVVRDGVGSNRDDGGQWIKTDSEFVVLEM